MNLMRYSKINLLNNYYLIILAFIFSSFAKNPIPLISIVELDDNIKIEIRGYVEEKINNTSYRTRGIWISNLDNNELIFSTSEMNQEHIILKKNKIIIKRLTNLPDLNKFNINAKKQKWKSYEYEQNTIFVKNKKTILKSRIIIPIPKVSKKNISSFNNKINHYKHKKIEGRLEYETFLCQLFLFALIQDPLSVTSFLNFNKFFKSNLDGILSIIYIELLSILLAYSIGGNYDTWYLHIYKSHK